MIENLRTQPMNLPGGGLPTLGSKALIPAVIIAGLTTLVIVRAAAMPQAANVPEQPAQLSPAIRAECEKNVWPYVTSGCLQGAAASENVRIVVGQPPPDAQTQMHEAEALIGAAARPQKRKRVHAQREHDGELIRERRARRNATFF